MNKAFSTFLGLTGFYISMDFLMLTKLVLSLKANQHCPLTFDTFKGLLSSTNALVLSKLSQNSEDLSTFLTLNQFLIRINFLMLHEL